MLTMTRPLPPTPYMGPVRTPRRPLPTLPPPPVPSTSGSPNTSLKRRPHARRLQSAPSSGLPSVTEEEEAEADDEHVQPVRPKRPRPTPLVPSRKYAPSSLPLIVEIPDNTPESDAFALSPSTLLTRRRSETILDFPVPPSLSRAIPIPGTSSPLTPADNSPTPSDLSASSLSSSPSPRTPHPSEVDENDVQLDADKSYLDWLDVRSPRQPYRSASVISLRSFNTAEFDAQADGIYEMLDSRRQPVARPVVPPRPENLTLAPPAPVSNPVVSPSPRLVLSVLDTTHGGSFEVPLVLGSFLSLPSSPSSSVADLDSEDDGEGIPILWSESEPEDSGSVLSSSEEEVSDNERGPSRWLDPEFRTKHQHRRLSRDGSRSPILPPLPMIEPLDMGPETPSVYSTPSPLDWNHERLPPRESLVPSDVRHESFALHPPPRPQTPPPPPRAPSPFYPARGDSPVLRSRFSTSTLGSLPPQPSSTTQAFFARLTSRVKPTSPTKSTRTSPPRRRHVPASPALSAFSFSTHSTSSRSSLDTDGSSLFSDDSGSSSGLRRPPIPIELFLRG